ncbi:hypothetical protein [Burkholderia ambifaria]|nr:hypothetical protein [Burkholderia ambifaria]
MEIVEALLDKADSPKSVLISKSPELLAPAAEEAPYGVPSRLGAVV